MDFDELSEEWIEQPAACATPSNREESSIQLPATSNALHSRIPRPSGLSELVSKKESRTSATHRPHTGNATSRQGTRHFSTRSLSSMTQGTVQIKDAKEPASNGQNIVTPDWKRRVLHGGNVQGQQQDLFSPIGLEGVFRPPPSRPGDSKRLSPQRPPQPKTAAPSQVFPSSPPVNPKPLRPSMSAYKHQLESSDSIIAAPNFNDDMNADNTREPIIPNAAHVDDLEQSMTLDLMDPQFASWKGSLDSQHQAHERLPTVVPVDLGLVTRSAERLQEQIDRMGIKEQGRPSSRSSDNDVDYGMRREVPTRSKGKGPHEPARNYSIDSLSLARNPGFITMSRGGTSDDSFMKLPLSPSSSQLPSLPAAPTPPTAHDPQVRDFVGTQESPITPARAKLSIPATGQTRSSGSPLKLFDNYDTFTNDRLNRRISQFEGGSDMGGTPKGFEARGQPPVSPSPKRAHYQGLGRGSRGSRDTGRINSFGAGELDAYGFEHRQESNIISEPTNNDEDQENQPPLPELDRNRQTHFRMLDDSDLALKEMVTNVNFSQHQVTQVSEYYNLEERLSEHTRNQDGKRTWNSPQKRRESKRQCTSFEPANASGVPQFIDFKARAPSIVGKKRKDARYDSSSPGADPEVIATRHRLRPRAVHAKSRDSSIGDPIMPGQIRSAYASRPMDTQTEVLAEQLAAFALGVADGANQGIRKPSIATADYFKEANFIMQNIRARARPNSSQAEAQAPDLLPDIEEGGQDEFSMDTVSRPPSREFRPLKPKAVNPRVVSHLRKFEDQGGSADGFSTLDSEHRSTRKVSPEPEPGESEPPNIRVRERQPAFSADEAQYGRAFTSNKDSQVKSQDSNASSGTTSGRSVPTASGSESSVKPATIGPDKVSHLLSVNMGKMTFDAKQKAWVKRKTASLGHDRIDSDMTEEDAFGGIPDLTVNESQEFKQLRPSTASTRSLSSGTNQPEDAHKFGPAKDNTDDNVADEQQARPSSSGTVGESSAFTKKSAWASSVPVAETRATSYGDQPPYFGKPTLAMTHALSSHEEEVTQEREIFAGHTATMSPSRNSRPNQARAVTVAFSSPLIEPTKGLDQCPEIWEDDSVLNLNSSPAGQESDADHATPGRRPMEVLQASSHRLNRYFSIGSRNFTPRPISRIDEDDEISFLAHPPTVHPSMELALSTPLPLRDMPGTLTMPPTAGRNSSVAFHLSPLPEFTMHQDQSLNLDVKYVGHGLNSIKEIEERFSLTIKDLVAKITEIEPYEPFWEWIRKLDLYHSEVITLHMLDQFCPRIEELNVNRCRLNQLNGAPSTLRDLKVAGNNLSSMTSWGHLTNLQYLNVAGNKIRSLKGLSCLVHLRELLLDYNEVETLDGIKRLNGLLKLTLSRCFIEDLNVDGSELHRLVNLDVTSNWVKTVTGLQQLIALERLNLCGNLLETFAIDSNTLPHGLKRLNLSFNPLSEINLSKGPSLSVINLDNCHIAEIKGIESLPEVNTVSWRHQSRKDSEEQLELQYQGCHEARMLYLSGNKIQTFSPVILFQNLHRLEIASCCIETLSDDFGEKMPNLRWLNLNYNALTTLEPLKGIVALEKLYVAGNRIERLRRTVKELAGFEFSLRVLDLLDNPLTHGFYVHGTVSDEDDPDFRYLYGVDDNLEYLYLNKVVDEEPEEECERRLDEGTLLKKRVYELLVLNDFPRLKQLDAMPLKSRRLVDRKEMMAKLVGLGVLSINVSRDDCVAPTDLGVTAERRKVSTKKNKSSSESSEKKMHIPNELRRYLEQELKERKTEMVKAKLPKEEHKAIAQWEEVRAQNKARAAKKLISVKEQEVSAETEKVMTGKRGPAEDIEQTPKEVKLIVETRQALTKRQKDPDEMWGILAEAMEQAQVPKEDRKRLSAVWKKIQQAERDDQQTRKHKGFPEKDNEAAEKEKVMPAKFTSAECIQILAGKEGMSAETTNRLITRWNKIAAKTPIEQQERIFTQWRKNVRDGWRKFQAEKNDVQAQNKVEANASQVPAEKRRSRTKIPDLPAEQAKTGSGKEKALAEVKISIEEEMNTVAESSKAASWKPNHQPTIKDIDFDAHAKTFDEWERRIRAEYVGMKMLQAERRAAGLPVDEDRLAEGQEKILAQFKRNVRIEHRKGLLEKEKLRAERRMTSDQQYVPVAEGKTLNKPGETSTQEETRLAKRKATRTDRKSASEKQSAPFADAFPVEPSKAAAQEESAPNERKRTVRIQRQWISEKQSAPVTDKISSEPSKATAEKETIQNEGKEDMRAEKSAQPIKKVKDVPVERALPAEKAGWKGR